MPPKEMLEELKCPYQQNVICVQRLTCMGGYCGKMIVNKVDKEGNVIETYTLRQENGSLVFDDNSN